jgi:hypothetical protein
MYIIFVDIHCLSLNEAGIRLGVSHNSLFLQLKMFYVIRTLNVWHKIINLDVRLKKLVNFDNFWFVFKRDVSIY